MLFLINPITKPVVEGGLKQLTKVGMGGLPSLLGNSLAGALAGELLFPKPVSDGTIPPGLENDNSNNPNNDLTQTDGGNPSGDNKLDPGTATPGKNYQISWEITFKNFSPNAPNGIEMTLSGAYNDTAPFSAPYPDYGISEAGNSIFLLINRGNMPPQGLMSGGVAPPFNPAYKVEVISFNWSATPLDGGDELQPDPFTFSPTPKPKPNPEINPEIDPIPDPNPNPGIDPIPGPNPDPNNKPDPDKSPFPIIIPIPQPYPVPKPYPVPQIITVPSPPKIITIPQPYPVPGPVQLVPYPVPYDLTKPNPPTPTPTPPVPPTQCNPCCECEETDLSDVMDLIDDILEQLNDDDDEIDWSEIKDYIDEKLECHEDSFKAIISNQKIDRMSILSTMSYSIHNALMLSFDVDSSNQYSLLAPSTESSIAFKEYCGEEGSVDYGAFVNEINSAIANIQSSIDYTDSDDDTFVNNSIIITTASSIWKAVVSGFQSIKHYCSILIKQISSIGNSLKYSKVVNDDDYEYMSDNADGLTPEQKAYDIGLVPGSSQSTILDSIANVTNPLSDVDLWQEIDNNKQSLENKAEEDKTTILDEISEIDTSLDNNTYPEFIMPEIMD